MLLFYIISFQRIILSFFYIYISTNFLFLSLFPCCLAVCPVLLSSLLWFQRFQLHSLSYVWMRFVLPCVIITFLSFFFHKCKHNLKWKEIYFLFALLENPTKKLKYMLFSLYLRIFVATIWKCNTYQLNMAT